MKARYFYSALFLALLSLSPGDWTSVWGFWGHRRINRLAVFTLPAEMAGFYKKHIEYITEHAVDPDKRRYATKFEAPRHFIDIDHWGTYPFPEVPRDWTGALMKYTDVYMITPAGDSLLILGQNVTTEGEGGRLFYSGREARVRDLFPEGIPKADYRRFFSQEFLSRYYQDEWVADCQVLEELLGRECECARVVAVDRFSEYGIVPYYLPQIQERLTNAFRGRNIPAILRLSAEIGHYIADAHVPLHTTENYNGQLTDQVGIHAFWESRLPELFADEQYDYFVGPAVYVAEPQSFYWDVVLDSHRLLDSVLLIEKELSREFPLDEQYCYEERLGRTIRTQCRAYAEAYHRRLDGMVESRMRDAIQAVGSIWYTAWVDAGQPNLELMGSDDPLALSEEEERLMKALNQAYERGNAKGRAHNN